MLYIYFLYFIYIYLYLYTLLAGSFSLCPCVLLQSTEDSFTWFILFKDKQAPFAAGCSLHLLFQAEHNSWVENLGCRQPGLSRNLKCFGLPQDSCMSRDGFLCFDAPQGGAACGHLPRRVSHGINGVITMPKFQPSSSPWVGNVESSSAIKKQPEELSLHLQEGSRGAGAAKQDTALGRMAEKASGVEPNTKLPFGRQQEGEVLTQPWNISVLPQ